MLILFPLAGQQQQGWPFSKQPFNIRAQVLILDVGSLSFQGNHPIAPPFAEEGCADACARTPGCNAWTYCSKKEGCGSGCKAYTDKNPQREVAVFEGAVEAVVPLEHTANLS